MHLRTAAELPAKRTASPHKIILYTTDQTYSSGFIGSIPCSISRILPIIIKRCLSELCIYKTDYTTYAPYHRFCYFHTLTPFFFLLVKIFLSHHSHLSIMYIVMLVNTKTPLIHILSKNVHLL